MQHVYTCIQLKYKCNTYMNLHTSQIQMHHIYTCIQLEYKCITYACVRNVDTCATHYMYVQLKYKCNTRACVHNVDTTYAFLYLHNIYILTHACTYIGFIHNHDSKTTYHTYNIGANICMCFYIYITYTN